MTVSDDELTRLDDAHQPSMGFCTGAHHGQTVWPCLVWRLVEAVQVARTAANGWWMDYKNERVGSDHLRADRDQLAAKLAAAECAAGFSTDGVNVRGDRASIDRVAEWHQSHAVLPEARRKLAEAEERARLLEDWSSRVRELALSLDLSSAATPEEPA